MSRYVWSPHSCREILLCIRIASNPVNGGNKKRKRNVERLRSDTHVTCMTRCLDMGVDLYYEVYIGTF